MQKNRLYKIIFPLILLLASFSFNTANAECKPYSKNSTSSTSFELQRFNRLLARNSNVTLCMDEDSVEIIVGVNYGLKGSYERINTLIVENHGKVIDTILAKGKPKALVADVPNEVFSSLKQKLLNHGLASYVEPNLRVRLAYVPNDEYWSQQWGLRKIEADHAWNTTVGNSSVIIAIIDTGVDWNHPDLTNNIWNNTYEKPGDNIDNDENGYVDDVRGWDFVETTAPVYPGEDGSEEDNDPMDFHGHGTHCAGIVAAVGNNSIGVCGTTWCCQIMPVRAGYKGEDGDGYLELDDAAQAITYAADNGAHIISCSWGGDVEAQIIREAIEYAYDAGVLLVAAAGNHGTDEPVYPAAYDEVIAVAATNNNDGRAFFSNFGDWIELSAPGTSIYSTFFDDSYASMHGTSMATPFVAGVAALVWSIFPDMSRDQVRAWLRFTCDDLGEEGFDVYFGYGRVNAQKAVEENPLEHDVAVFSLSVPQVVLVGEKVAVNTTIVNMGEFNESGLSVHLILNGSLIDSDYISTLNKGESFSLSFSWNTSSLAPATYNLTVYVLPVPNETAIKNNALSQTVLIKRSEILKVPQDYASIQEAVDAALKGDIVLVSAGIYYENVRVEKDFVKIVGENWEYTIVDGRAVSDVFSVEGRHVEICNLTVRNSGKSTYLDPPLSGVFLYQSSHCVLDKLQVVDNRGGIFLYCSKNVSLKNSRMENNVYNFGVDGYELEHFMHDIDVSNLVGGKPLHYVVNENGKVVPSEAGCVFAVNSTGIVVEGSNITSNYMGVSLVFSVRCQIRNVQASQCRIGVYLYRSNNSEIDFSIFYDGHYGAYLLNSRNNTFVRNVFRECAKNGVETFHSEENCFANNFFVDNVRGLFLRESSYNNVSFNTFMENGIGAWLYHSENITFTSNILSSNTRSVDVNDVYNSSITRNHIKNNDYGLLVEGSYNNLIHHNNLINNGFQAYLFESLNFWDDGYPNGGNYWSDHVGEDNYSGPYQNETGSDGIVDNPYVIDEYNIDHYPLTQPIGIHDVKLVNVTPSIREAYVGWSIKINVTVQNKGTTTENLTVTCKYLMNNTEYLIETSEIQNLPPEGLITLTFEWKPQNFAVCVLKCEVSVVEGEFNFFDNVLIDGTVNVRIFGDINDDGKVDITDVAQAASAFSSYPTHPRWNPMADMNQDGKIDLIDIALIAKNFGKSS